MKDREKEYKELFIAESLQEYDDLSNHVVKLEQNPEDDKILAEIFRLLHNLKANAKAIGYLHISELAHQLENVISLLRKHELKFNNNINTILLDGIDYLGVLLQDIDNPDLKKLDSRIVSALNDVIQNVSNETTFSGPVKKHYTSQNITLSELIYIQVKKLDDILNLVGELIIDRDRILAYAEKIDSPELRSISAHLERITNDLQFSIMNARLVDMGSLFNKFPRIVRDIAATEDKKVKLSLQGEGIQIDRNILQIITDSLLHIIRNAITHGIEPEAERIRKNKPVEGLLKISASSDKDIVIINVADDGSGMNVEEIKRHAISQDFISEEKADKLSDSEILSFIFEPGFSMSKTVSELSGRGVGLDIVKNALDAIGGRIVINSEKNKGSSFSLHLPNTIAVKGALLFEADRNTYAIPLNHTESVVHLPKEELHSLDGSYFTDIKGETIPLIFLADFFKGTHSEIKGKSELTPDKFPIVIINYNNRKLGLIVDSLLRQQEIVVKMLQKPLDNIDLFSGVTLLGTGEICLVLDIPAISKRFLIHKDKYAY